MKQTRSLHEYIAEANEQVDEYMRNHPGIHPVELYKQIAVSVVEWVKEDGLQEIAVHPAVFNGGVPEYTFAISKLEENGIKVIKMER